MHEIMDAAFQRIFEGKTHQEIASACGIGRTSVTNWTKVPARHVLAVEALTGVSRHELRPDIFGMPEKEGEPVAA